MNYFFFFFQNMQQKELNNLSPIYHYVTREQNKLKTVSINWTTTDRTSYTLQSSYNNQSLISTTICQHCTTISNRRRNQNPPQLKTKRTRIDQPKTKRPKIDQPKIKRTRIDLQNPDHRTTTEIAMMKSGDDNRKLRITSNYKVSIAGRNCFQTNTDQEHHLRATKKTRFHRFDRTPTDTMS